MFARVTLGRHHRLGTDVAQLWRLRTEVEVSAGGLAPWPVDGRLSVSSHLLPCVQISVSSPPPGTRTQVILVRTQPDDLTLT